MYQLRLLQQASGVLTIHLAWRSKCKWTL